MSNIIFECDVTCYNVMPKESNNENSFAICDDCLVINIMDTTKIKDKFLMQTEIEKKDAIELAKLILLKYNVL